MLNIVMIGPPGAGKGTQSKRIAARYGLLHISTGDILRKEIQNITELGVEAKKYIDKGDLVPDDLVIEILFSTIQKEKELKGIVFDGFPRTENQAVELDKRLQDSFKPITMALAFTVDEDELIKRLANRATLELDRTDDRKEIVEKRLQIFNRLTQPIIERYEGQGKLHRVYGIGTVEEIFAEICDLIEKNK